ncbi:MULTISPECIES: PQQ-binding-like beta-propeller repeat protein [unclassified Streptomyces]|uniref:outer membrane protein assembly factor BamB family protein n=1 Tax=unclassified Streptomyces TaxID=2593676 RepID=UPI002E813B4A|nr:PQQ-binding-like beta-propeller repeat protein [Streptomyces sp. NBC_00562]WUC20412.1 PQQ-binding-like beta-propeller repeat protein [Streptomyces sp. NBC_00562]
MTQPPQPPNEPPQRGFGAPQDPPPGGFGAPVPPPADPFGKQPPTPPAGGFGAPQAQPPAGGFGAPQNPPAGPPQQQPGYGYPQQPGYGYPPGPPAGQGLPPGQPPQQGYGYGYPTAPMQSQYAPPQQGGNGGKKFTTQMQIIVAAVVAVAVIIGGGIFLASGGDDKKNEVSSAGPTGEGKGGEDGGVGGGGKERVPANTKSTVAFQLPEPKVGDVTTVDGSWLTDKAYVKTGVDEIVGYDKAKGTKLWSIPLEGQLCAASRHMSKDYKTAIVFEEGKPTKAKKYQPCNQVGGIDLNTGKLMWSKPVTAATSGDDPVRFDEVTLSGTTVAAGGTEGGAAFDLNTGAERWKPKVGTDGCYDKGYGGGDALAVVRKCGTYDSPQLVIQALNPTTGAPLSSFKMPPGVDYASIVSTKPLVVAADVGDTAGDGSGISDFFSIDASTGKLLTKIAADGEKYAARCGSTEVETCQQLAVGNNRLYLPTEEHEGTGEYGDTNEIVSFDLTTGKPTSDKADAGDRYTMFPIRMDGSNIIAYKVPPYDKGGQIVSIDGSTFKQTVLMENPGDESVRDAETSFSMDYAEILYSGGRMYISEVMVSKPRESSLDDKQYLAVSFATG